MRKKSFLALLLMAAIALSGCSLVVKDEKVDAARVIVDVNGETVNKQTVNAQVDNYLNQQASYYSQYGYSIDVTDEAMRSSAADVVINSNIQSLVKQQKIKELGYDQFTEEELAAITADVDTQYSNMLDTVKLFYLGNSTNEGDALTAEAEEYATKAGYTKDILMEDAKTQKAEEKLKAEAVKDVAVSEDEIKTDYDAKVENAKTSYEADVTAYGKSVNNGETVYYAPSGYRYVKQVLVKFKAEDSTAISTLKSSLTTAQNELTTAQTALSSNETSLSAADITDEEKASLTEAQTAIKTTVEEAQKKIDDLNAQIEKATATAYENIKATADEAYQKAIAGEDFQALIDAYNEDPGMTTEPGKTNGYAICAGYTPFETSFVEAGMALKSIGDVSEPTKGSYGYYIIRYQSDVTEGAVALETVHDTIQSALLTAKQDDAFAAAVQAWQDASKVKTYKDRLTD